MGEFNVHRVRFFNYVPSGIRCVAYNNQSNRLAVSRTDGTVEIYNLSANYFQEKVSHLGAWFGGVDVFSLKFSSAKSSMSFLYSERSEDSDSPLLSLLFRNTKQIYNLLSDWWA